jgi:hypothetical protein
VKHLASWGFVIVLVQPICDLGVVPPLLTESAYVVVKELLVCRTECNPEIGKSHFQGESEVNIGVEWVD